MGSSGKDTDTYDYIIVGSGSAGSLVASRLSEDPAARVLVVEAGGSDAGFWLRLPVGYFKSIYNQRFSHLYKSEPGVGVSGRQIDCPRGRVVGGSSSINGLIFIRGQQEDYNDWEASGAKGWGYQQVLPHFRKFENYQGKPSQYRGAHGGLTVSDLRNQNDACDSWMQAAMDTGLPANEDFNGESTYGIGSYQLTLNGRWRESAATAFLKPALERSNLTLSTGAHVTRVIIQKDRAIGIEYMQGSELKKAHAACEVILSGGAVQTPQVLQLSGVGPADRLLSLGITPVVDAPEVGENLQDHLQMRTIVELSTKGASLNDHVRNPLRLAKMGLDWLVQAKGPLTVGAGQVGGAVCSKYAQNGRPDLQLFVMPLSVDKPGTPLHRYSGFTTSFWQCHPQSRGSIHIRSADPNEDPAIQPNYLTTEQDCKVMVEGLKMVRDIYQQPAFKSRWNREVIPGADHRSDAEILTAIRQNASTVYHLVGTCRMGSDPKAVVDPQLRVNGIDGLRVIDSSVMPKIPSANTNAATYMIAEKGAAMIRDAQ